MLNMRVVILNQIVQLVSCVKTKITELDSTRVGDVTLNVEDKNLSIDRGIGKFDK